MKAIETEYGGVLFRSRLEARWAVFFDALSIEWQYEPEGFELADGTRYLPDFLVCGGAYAEVKPANDGFAKARRFAAESGRSVWLCAGEPQCKPWKIILCIGDASDHEREFIWHPGKGHLWIDPSPEECQDFLAEAVAHVRAHRFWNPRKGPA